MASKLGRQIAQARKAKGLSASGLAAAVGIDAGTLSRIESGETPNPSFNAVVRIARALNLDLGTFKPAGGGERLPVATKAQLVRMRAQLRKALDVIDRVLEDG